jgi:hypothetical protein
MVVSPAVEGAHITTKLSYLNAAIGSIGGCHSLAGLILS